MARAEPYASAVKKLEDDPVCRKYAEGTAEEASPCTTPSTPPRVTPPKP
jgi:hypothetical protein